MKQPYFVERDLPHLVRKYMETHTEVDIDVLTQNLIDEQHKFRHKKFKPFRKSVTEAYKWNYYLMEKEEKAAANAQMKSDGSSDNVKQEDLDVQLTNENNGGVDDEIIDCIIKKNRKEVLQQQFSTEAPKLQELKGLSSVVKPVRRILWQMINVRLNRWTIRLRLTGPDSCGKTTLIRSMADNMSLPLYFIRVKSVLSGGPLSSPLKRMQEELKKAREILPGVIVFHKLDVLYSRESTSSSKHEQETVADAVFDFIAEMANNNNGVKALLVAETSRPEVLDWDLDKYFTQHLHIAPPSIPDKESVLRKLLGSDVDPEVDLTSVALKASGFVAGDLVSLVTHANELVLNRVCDDPMYAETKSFEDFAPNVLLFEGDAPNLQVTMEDLMEAIKLVTPSLKRQGFPVIPDTTWADIAGLDLAKDELRHSILMPIKDPEYCSKFGLGKNNSGILLWGPPGCGKTLLAKAVANEAGVNLLTVNGPELLSMYQGESERAVREVFARAKSVAPCVIFFDEFDSLCPRRSKTGSDSGSKSTIVNTLLTEMDGFHGRPDIYLIAATNLPDLLDPAVLRPGRFGTKIYVGLPTVQGRVAVFMAATKNGTMPCIASDVDFDAIAKRRECELYTGADCMNLVSLAEKLAMQEHQAKVREAQAGAAPDLSDGEPANNKRKRVSSGDSGRPAKIACGDSADGVSVQPMLDCYPEGEFLIYARHFDAAFQKIEPSVLEEDLRMHELQQKKFKSGRLIQSVAP